MNSWLKLCTVVLEQDLLKHYPAMDDLRALCTPDTNAMLNFCDTYKGLTPEQALELGDIISDSHDLQLSTISDAALADGIVRVLDMPTELVSYMERGINRNRNIIDVTVEPVKDRFAVSVDLDSYARVAIKNNYLGATGLADTYKRVTRVEMLDDHIHYIAVIKDKPALYEAGEIIKRLEELKLDVPAGTLYLKSNSLDIKLEIKGK